MAILMILGRLTCIISGFCWYTFYFIPSPFCLFQWRCSVMVIWFQMVDWLWCDNIVVKIFQSVVLQLAFLGVVFFTGTCTGGYFPGQYSGTFSHSGKLLGRKLSRDIYQYSVLLLYLKWYIFYKSLRKILLQLTTPASGFPDLILNFGAVNHIFLNLLIYLRS